MLASLMSALTCLLIYPLVAVVAQESNLNPNCNGDGPGALNSFYPNVDQFCVGVDGAERCYYLLIPEGTTGSVPLVFDIHAWRSCPIFSVFYTGWYELAQEHKFVLVWPLGVTDAAIADGTCFAFKGGVTIDDTGNITPDCCCTLGLEGSINALEDISPETLVDPDITKDADFLRTAIEQVIDSVSVGSDVSIDSKKVFMAGHSNGCVASLSMAALHSDLVTGVACHAGKSITPFAEGYIPVPTFIVHGMKDATLLYDEFIVSDGLGFASTPDQFMMIANKNGCDEDILTETLPDDEGMVETRTGCLNDADVTLVTLTLGGHGPYLGFDDEEFSPGSKITTIDTTLLAWKFLSMIGAEKTTAAPVTTVAPSPVTTAAPVQAPSAVTTPTPSSSAVVLQSYIAITIMAFCLVGILF